MKVIISQMVVFNGSDTVGDNDEGETGSIPE